MLRLSFSKNKQEPCLWEAHGIEQDVSLALAANVMRSSGDGGLGGRVIHANERGSISSIFESAQSLRRLFGDCSKRWNHATSRVLILKKTLNEKDSFQTFQTLFWAPASFGDCLSFALKPW